MTLRRACNSAITIDKIIPSWEPDGGEKIVRIGIKNNTVWEDPFGQPSGSILDITDTILAGAVAHPVNEIVFDSNMQGKTLTMMFIMLPRAFVSGKRINEVIETDTVINDPEEPKTFPDSFKGAVEFKDVSFAYPGAKKNVVENITFTAQPGQIMQ